MLLALSILPMLQLQSAILFNRAFATILHRKIHKQELLDDLYTPGLFYQVEAQQQEKPPPGGLVGRTLRGARRGSVAMAKGLGNVTNMRRGSLVGRRAAPPSGESPPPQRAKGGTDHRGRVRAGAARSCSLHSARAPCLAAAQPC